MIDINKWLEDAEHLLSEETPEDLTKWYQEYRNLMEQRAVHLTAQEAEVLNKTFIKQLKETTFRDKQ